MQTNEKQQEQQRELHTKLWAIWKPMNLKTIY